MSILINSSYAQSLANFEDPILGIKFQYPTEWDPVTLTQKGNLNTIKFNNPYYTTKFPVSLLESRNTSDVQLKIENFFPLEINLLQYMDKVFSKARFLPDFKVVELDKMATFGGIARV